MLVAHSVSRRAALPANIRPARPRQDLAAIADLIAVGFAETLDAQGRLMLRDMRETARWGLLSWKLARWLGVLPPLRGYVWEEDGRIVGNVSLTPAGYGRGWIVANVVVLPSYRRRGIARALMEVALEDVAQRGAFAILQVLEENEAARKLYRKLGFVEERAFTRWRRLAYAEPTPPPTAHVQRLRHKDADALLALAESERPNARGGLGWLRPTRPEALRPPRWAPFLSLSGKLRTYWGIWAGPNALEAALGVTHLAGSYTLHFDAFARPKGGGREALLEQLARFLARRFEGRVLVTEHPSDDTAATHVWRAYRFHPERTLVHMIWRVPDDERSKEHL